MSCDSCLFNSSRLFNLKQTHNVLCGGTEDRVAWRWPVVLQHSSVPNKSHPAGGWKKKSQEPKRQIAWGKGLENWA